jgi:4-amino-4-deoxy-L-arabinose transferase-like glycosyltransferase
VIIKNFKAVVISDRNFRWILIALVSFSLIPRLINLDQSLLDLQPFRQTQTAMTVWMFLTEGVDLFNYQTPIFGPPFYAPFEFPLYQYFAVLIFRLGISDIEIASRITTILFYILSCWSLYKVIHLLFKSRKVTLLTLVHFCFTPFSINWSRAVTIEYCALFFCLLTLYFFLLLRTKHAQNYWHLMLGTLIACLAFSIKLTTAYPYVLFMFLVFGYDSFKQLKLLKKNSSFSQLRLQFWPLILKGILFFVLPFGLMYLWVRHTDLLKMESAFSYVTTSSSLKDWNFGTWDDKLSWNNWMVIFNRINNSLLPFMLAIPLIVYFTRASGQHFRKYVFLLLFFPLVTIATFFNLYYQHDYYLAALMPFFSILFALSMLAFVEFLWVPFFRKNYKIYTMFMAAGLVLLIYTFVNDDSNKEYYRYLYSTNQQSDYEQYVLGQAIAKTTKPDELVIVTDFEWSSEVLYSAKRKGLMWTDGNELEINRFRSDLHKTPYACIVSRNPDRYPKLLSEFSIKQKFKRGPFYFFMLN